MKTLLTILLCLWPLGVRAYDCPHRHLDTVDAAYILTNPGIDHYYVKCQRCGATRCQPPRCFDCDTLWEGKVVVDTADSIQWTVPNNWKWGGGIDTIYVDTLWPQTFPEPPLTRAEVQKMIDSAREWSPPPLYRPFRDSAGNANWRLDPDLTIPSMGAVQRMIDSTVAAMGRWEKHIVVTKVYRPDMEGLWYFQDTPKEMWVFVRPEGKP